jgi:hypothetical protein
LFDIMNQSISFLTVVCSLALLLAMLPAAQSFTVDYAFKSKSHDSFKKPALSLKAEDLGDEISTLSDNGRRRAFSVMTAGGVSLGAVFGSSSNKNLKSVMTANALDMDAFINSELASDTKNCNPKKDPKCLPKLSADEALCQYGQVGAAKKIEACKRVKEAGGKLPDPAASAGKSLGGAYAM